MRTKLRTAQIEECADELVGDSELSARQKKFIVEYLKDNNAIRAAIRAGYSEKNADKIGPQLLGKTRVAQEIAQQQKSLIVRSFAMLKYGLCSLFNTLPVYLRGPKAARKNGTQNGTQK